MEINIIRGQNQIGGSIIEVSSKNTKIILDIACGLNSGVQKYFVRFHLISFSMSANNAIIAWR